MIDRLRTDTVAAVRSLRSTPIPVAAALLTLAISTGLNLAMFGLIDRALLGPPLLVPDAERIFTLGFETPDHGGSATMATTSYPTFEAIRDGAPDLAGVAAFQRLDSSVVINGDQRAVKAMWVSGEYFDVLGVRAWIGRAISQADDRAEAAAPSAVLSHAFWSSAFGRDREIVGRRIIVRGLDYTVIGVMPSGFSGHSTADVDLWVPFAAALRGSPGWDQDAFRNVAAVLVRLDERQGEAHAAAQAAAAAGRRVTLLSTAGTDVAVDQQRVAWWLTAIAILVLVIGLANTATLLVVRAAKTRFGAAVRSALGASRSRLIGQALIEAAFLAGAATVLALALAWWMDEAVRRVLFPELVMRPGAGATTPWVAGLAGLLAGLTAAAANLGALPSSLLRPADLTRSGGGAGRRTRLTTGLLLVQTTLSVLLLAGAGLFASSLYRLRAQDFGMRLDGVLIVGFEEGPGDVAGQDEIFTAALERVRRLPGVESATVIDAIPFSGFHVPPISVPGRAEPPSVDHQLPHLTAATPEYLGILDIRVVEGRALVEADERGAPVVLVNQSMATGVWPGESALGKCIRVGFDPDFDPASFDPSGGPPMPAKVPCREVVGVTRDVRQRSVLPFDREDRLMQYYVPFAQVPRPPFADDGPRLRGLLLRTQGEAEAMVPAIRRLVLAGRTDLPFVQVRPYRDLLERQMRPWTIGTKLLGLWSALALAVAAVGLYAAFAHAVASRRREMAVRLAVGAAPKAVRRMVLREALNLAGIGVGLGSAATLVAGRWVRSMLFDTQPFDPLVLGSAAAAMLLVAAISTWIPATTASRTDPNALLRAE